MKLTSPSFADGAPMPARHHLKQGNRSPELRFEGQPAGTKSLALVCDDPGAPGGSWTHWLLWDMPPGSAGLRQGIPPVEVVPDVAHQGRNDYGVLGWGGPCPPGGVHRYVFTLYALDIALGPRTGMTRRELSDLLPGHVIAQASLVGTFDGERSCADLS